VEHGQASSRRAQRRIEERKNLLNAQEVPPWHGEAVLGEGADDTSASHVIHQAPDLAEGKAKRLETKLEVAMAEIQSTGGDRDESTRGVIDQIS
jgi:hypothetical protein